MNQKNNNVFKEIIAKADVEQPLKDFRQKIGTANTVRVPYVLLNARKYSFADTKTNNTISGVTFTLTDGTPLTGDNNGTSDEKGICVVSFSMNDNNMFNKFTNFPVPPVGVFCDIRIGKKSTLVAVTSFTDIIAQAAITDSIVKTQTVKIENKVEPKAEPKVQPKTDNKDKTKEGGAN